MDLTD
jgi:hypothetical protein